MNVSHCASLTAVCHESVKNATSGLTAHSIADLLGRDYQTLMSELSRQRGHKLGADMVLPIIKLTGSPAIMNFMARELGGVFVQMRVEAGRCELVDSLLSCVREFGEFAAEVSTDIADGKLPQSQYMRICKEGQEAMSAILHMMELARKAHEQQHEGHHHDS